MLSLHSLHDENNLQENVMPVPICSGFLINLYAERKPVA